MVGKTKVHYDGLLRMFIQTGQNEQFKMLNEDLLKNSTNWKTLLHHAAFYSNDVIIQHLIDMGLNVDALDSNGKTALMIAVEVRSLTVVKILLEANASIHITDIDGKSSLDMVFDSEYFSSKILESILRRLFRDCSNSKMLVNKLVDAGFSMYHATYLRDTQVMEMLINCGIDINSRGYCKETALHVAVQMNDLNMLEWILNKGGDVDALNEYYESPLDDAAKNGKADLVRLLLKHGANPNTRHPFTGCTPLFTIFASSLHEHNQANFDKCAELLLRHGAIPKNSSIEHHTLLDYGLLNYAPNKKVEYLIGQLAILERLGKSNVESVMISNVEEHNSILLELKNIYESCKNLLELIIYGGLSLFDLLTQNENKMRNYVRNKVMMSRIHFICSMLNKMYPYYSRILKKRISIAEHTAKLENEAVFVISKLFNANYHLCYNFARHVVGYLDRYDLKQLYEV